MVDCGWDYCLHFAAVETLWPDGTPIGLPVRGYGVMVLLGLFAGIGLTSWRGKQVGVAADVIISLGFWMMVGGVIGARAFFVVQYWDEFLQYPPAQRWIAVVKLTEGGLVIYGGMIGGVIAGMLFCWKTWLSSISFGDLIAPGFSSDRPSAALVACSMAAASAGSAKPTYPRSSFLKEVHLILHSWTAADCWEPTRNPLDSLKERSKVFEPGSLAEAGWQAQPGMPITIEHRPIPPTRGVDDPARTPAVSANVQIDHQSKILSSDVLPAWSLPVHPSQVYSAVDSFLLCLLIVCLQPWVKRDGQAFFTAVGLHGVARFTLELIRSDEMGKFGTSLTIAQWISLCGIAVALLAWAITFRLPAKRAWLWRSTGC